MFRDGTSCDARRYEITCSLRCNDKLGLVLRALGDVRFKDRVGFGLAQCAACLDVLLEADLRDAYVNLVARCQGYMTWCFDHDYQAK